jgi:hypothetical protein
MGKRAIVPKRDALVFPGELLGKSEIEKRMREALHEQIQGRPAPQLYLMLKQIEYAVAMALDELKPTVIDEVRTVLPEGENSMTLSGHTVSLKPKSEWTYGQEVFDLAARQKKELEAERAIAKAEGRATKTVTGTIIAVELAP